MKESEFERDFDRPWGGYIRFIDNKPCTVKILEVKGGEELSLQSHNLREEFWYVVKGEIEAITGRDKDSLRSRIMKEKEYVFIPKRTLHRIKGISFPDSKVLEISTGIFRENDEIRYEDKYNRKSPEQ